MCLGRKLPSFDYHFLKSTYLPEWNKNHCTFQCNSFVKGFWTLVNSHYGNDTSELLWRLLTCRGFDSQWLKYLSFFIFKLREEIKHNLRKINCAYMNKTGTALRCSIFTACTLCKGKFRKQKADLHPRQILGDVSLI